MPEISWNSSSWDGTYDWSQAGEEWSAPWGSSEAQWFGTLLPRIHRWLPAKRILEIAPGFGRWTRFLLSCCDEFTGIDLSNQCITSCIHRFKGKGDFIQNDGVSLDGAKGKFDFIFSFDSLVHADIDVFESYIPQIVEKLSDGGIAFLHHSNYSASGATNNIYCRSENVTAEKVSNLIKKSGGGIIRQETINWFAPELIDCLTLFCATPIPAATTPIEENTHFSEEANYIKLYIHPYCARVWP